MAHPKTIWPIVVLAGDTVPPTPVLWDWLRQELNGRIDVNADPRIRRPLVIDLDDLEPLLALVEQGESLFGLLGRFLASNLSEFPMRNWIAREFTLTGEGRPRYVVEQWKLAGTAGGSVLYPGSEKLTHAFDQDDLAA